MNSMFEDAAVFNQDISGWNVSNVTDMKEMFSGATNMSQNIWVWDVCGNASFTEIFENSDMSGVLNINDVSGGDDATQTALGITTEGSWFTGPPYTFTQRGWTTGAYAPVEGTLFYAVDLYSNDASQNQAITLYGDIDTWQFDYNANGGELKNFSDLFHYDAPGASTGQPVDLRQQCKTNEEEQTG